MKKVLLLVLFITTITNTVVAQQKQPPPMESFFKGVSVLPATLEQARATGIAYRNSVGYVFASPLGENGEKFNIELWVRSPDVPCRDEQGNVVTDSKGNPTPCIDIRVVSIATMPNIDWHQPTTTDADGRKWYKNPIKIEIRQSWHNGTDYYDAINPKVQGQSGFTPYQELR